MTLGQLQKESLFATETGGPMVFTFDRVLTVEKKKLSRDIQSNGGIVIEHSQRNEHTIVLAKPSKHSIHEIQFKFQYVKDCLKMKKLLPLETYRLDKKIEIGCYYSKPFGSNGCMYAKLILRGICKKHNCAPTDQSAEKFNSDNEAKIKQQLESIKSLIYVERKPKVKLELDMPKSRMEEAQEESQSFDESQSLLRKKVK